MTTRDATFCAALLVLGFYAGCADRRASVADAARKTFEARATAAERLTTQFRAYAATDSARSADAARRSASLRDSLRFARARLVLTDTRLDSLMATFPAPTTARDTLYIAAATHYRAVADTALQLLVVADSVHALDSLALDRARAAERWTRLALDSVSAALAARPKPNGPSFWARLVPKPYAGYGAVLTGGIIRAGPSVGIGWALAL